jgi:hypothetical protein
MYSSNFPFLYVATATRTTCKFQVNKFIKNTFISFKQQQQVEQQVRFT